MKKFTRLFELKLKDFSDWERFRSSGPGPLGEAGVAGCGCMALWWRVQRPVL